MDNNRIKKIRIDHYKYMIWYILAIIIILMLEAYTKSLLYIIFAISSFTFINLLFFSTVLYKMWEDIIEAIEEIKDNKSKNG
jgi:predicted neutral ceramidase superfamily lipid hydrolase